MRISTVEADALWLIADALEDEGRCDVAGIESAAIRQGARRIEALEAQLAEAQARPVRVKVKPLDLSRLLEHAFNAGRKSVSGASSFAKDAWVEYDPAECAAYDRILSALEPASVGVEEAMWRLLDACEKYVGDQR